MTFFHVILCLFGSGILLFVVLQNIISHILKEKRYAGKHTLMGMNGINPFGTIMALREVTGLQSNQQTKHYYQRILRLYGISLIGSLVIGFIGLPLAHYFSYGELDKQLEKAELKALELPLPSDSTIYAFLNEVLPADSDSAYVMVERNIRTFDLSSTDSLLLIGRKQLFSPLDRFYIYRQNENNRWSPAFGIDTALFRKHSLVPKDYAMEFPDVVTNKAFWNGFHEEYGDSTGFFYISRPYFSADFNVAILHTETFSGFRKAGGRTYIYRRKGHKWKKVDQLTGWKAD